MSSKPSKNPEAEPTTAVAAAQSAVTPPAEPAAPPVLTHAVMVYGATIRYDLAQSYAEAKRGDQSQTFRVTPTDESNALLAAMQWAKGLLKADMAQESRDKIERVKAAVKAATEGK